MTKESKEENEEDGPLIVESIADCQAVLRAQQSRIEALELYHQHRERYSVHSGDELERQATVRVERVKAEKAAGEAEKARKQGPSRESLEEPSNMRDLRASDGA